MSNVAQEGLTMPQRNKTCALITEILLSYGCDPGFPTQLPDSYRDADEVIHVVFIALGSKGLDPNLLPQDIVEKIENAAQEVCSD